MPKTIKIAVIIAVALTALASYFNPQPLVPPTVAATSSQLSITQLPFDARNVWQRIQTNGPFLYPKKDGEFFGNFEKRLPTKPKGYYRSYTVPTKGLSHRGPKRLVAGGRSKTKPDVVYYTDDHYQSFSAIKL